MKKSLLMITFIVMSSLLFGGCWSRTQEEPPVQSPSTMNDSKEDSQTDNDSNDSFNAQGDMELTLEELDEYDGTDGNRAYVAINGIIYDITDSTYWNEEGENDFEAGKDVTGKLGNVTPQMVNNVKGIERIGILVD